MTDAIRTPDVMLEGLPDFPWDPRFRQWDGLRLAHVDEGDGAPVVFWHGEPTWGFLWRKVARRVPLTFDLCAEPLLTVRVDGFPAPA